MAFRDAEWSIDYTNKTIENLDSAFGTGLPSVKGTDGSTGTVLAFFQWCASTFANQTQMDDDYAFVSDTPTVYRFVNGWKFARDASDYKYLTGGSIESSDSSLLWSNLYSIGSQEVGTQLYMKQGNFADAGATEEEVKPWWISGNVDILVEVRRDGQEYYTKNLSDVSIAGGVFMYAREFGELYDHNFSTLSGGGRTPIGINTAADANNLSGEVSIGWTTSSGTLTKGNFLYQPVSGVVAKVTSVNGNTALVSGIRYGDFTTAGTLSDDVSAYSDREHQTKVEFSARLNEDASAVKGYGNISITFGEITRDLVNGAGFRNYDCEVNGAGRSMAQIYQYLKWVTRYDASGNTRAPGFINGDDGNEYRSADETLSGESPYAEVKVAPFGTLAGTTLFAARGIWITNAADSDFVLIDASGTSQSPPNYQKVTVTHSSLVGTQIFVAEIAASEIVKDQYVVDSSTDTTIVVVAAIDANKTPASGIIRWGDVSYGYTSYDSLTFSGVSPTPTLELDASIYVPFMDRKASSTTENSANIIYSSDTAVRTNVRKYGFKPYTIDTTFGSAGLAFSPILGTDPQAT